MLLAAQMRHLAGYPQKQNVDVGGESVWRLLAAAVGTLLRNETGNKRKVGPEMSSSCKGADITAHLWHIAADTRTS